MCRVFKPKEFDFAAKVLICGLDQSYFHANSNVEISCLNWNNLGTINCNNLRITWELSPVLKFWHQNEIV